MLKNKRGLFSMILLL